MKAAARFRVWFSTGWRLIAAGLLLLAYFLMVSSALQKSATVDEQSHLFRGVAYLEAGATHFLLGHPLLGGTLSALGVLSEPELKLPIDTPAWESGNWSAAGDQFLWQLNDRPLRIIFLGRLPVIWLTLLLGAVLFRWGRQWAGVIAGCLVLGLALLDPNILAHGRFITGDLPLTLFFVTTLYGYWRWARTTQPGAPPVKSLAAQRPGLYLLLAGAGLGLAGATKFNAALLVPILAIWSLVLTISWRDLRPVVAFMVTLLVGWFTIWAVYGFELWHGYLPGGAFWDDLIWLIRYVGDQHGVYLFGESSPTGWWYYFPVAFVLKTPLPSLILLAVSLVLLTRRDFRQAGLFLLLPAALYFVGSMGAALNIGYRYLIPILPFLFLLIATTMAQTRRLEKQAGIFTAAVIGLYVLLALWIWPNYVPYFNVLAGQDSWTILSDSNVDWGQDLPALKAWQQEQDAQIKLSYFGTAHPSAYGLTFEPLPTWAPGPEQGDPNRQSYNPVDPAPGDYAISVTNLHGVVLGEEREAYAFFREQEPLARIGGSTFVYRVPATGDPADVAFSGLRPADLESGLHELLKTNDVRVRWFDGLTSFIWPSGGGWLATDEAKKPSLAALAAFWPTEPAAVAPGQELYRLNPPPELDWAGGPADFGSELTFLGQEYLAEPDEHISLLTAWQAQRPTDRPLKLFVHALDAQGNILGQWDGLDVDPATWRRGDEFVQWHQFELTEGARPAKMALGVYDGETLERLGEPIEIPFPNE